MIRIDTIPCSGSIFNPVLLSNFVMDMHPLWTVFELCIR